MNLTYWLVLIGIWVGHSAIWLVGLNIIYSQPIHRAILSCIRLLVAIIIFGFPIFVLTTVDLNLAPLESIGPFIRLLALNVYFAICLIVSCWIIPLTTLRRLFRPTPAQLVAHRSRAFDAAKELGAKPVGDDIRGRLALLPGNQVFQVEFTELTLQIPELPAAWDGLTILQLSDLHLTGTPDKRFYELVIKRCMLAGTPDIVALTGDLVDTATHHRWLLPLLHELDWNEAAFAILGNHDRWHQPTRIRRRLSRLGMTVLGNKWAAVSIRGETLLAIGHEGPWFRPAPELSECPPSAFRLLLSHTPDNIVWARRHGIQLMLSGHNHGGQIRLPLFGSLFVPSRFSRQYDGGLFWDPPTLLYVNRGLGGKEPLRFNCRPEVTRFILKKG